MERKDFEAWLENLSATFLALTDLQRNEALDDLIALSGAAQLRHLSNSLETLLKRDFLKLLPLELSFYLLRWLDPQTLLTCCLVSKQWNKVISACLEVWQAACRNLGWQIDDSVQDALHWKKAYLKAILRMKQLQDHEAFETSSLIGHSARVYALYYKDGLLCTGRAVLDLNSCGESWRRAVVEAYRLPRAVKTPRPKNQPRPSGEKAKLEPYGQNRQVCRKLVLPVCHASAQPSSEPSGSQVT